jgi:hypothetical protein
MAIQTPNFRTAKEAADWYTSQIQNIGSQGFSFSEETQKNKNFTTITIGKMFLFAYDAKYKDTLPFFDQFPLVIPFEFVNQGFMGLNLHYLPPGARGSLLDALASTMNNDKYNDTTILQINYQLLKQSANAFSGYENCVKKYLFGHVKSQLKYIDPKDWDKVVMLPIHKWYINPNSKYSSKASPPY